jgi:hypothetical protein
MINIFKQDLGFSDAGIIWNENICNFLQKHVISNIPREVADIVSNGSYSVHAKLSSTSHSSICISI